MKKGFTLIELLVVISIIGLLSSIVLASVNVSREKARNAKYVQDIRAYMVAAELYRSNYGDYPDHGLSTSVYVCLGDSYSNDNCWLNGSNVNENSALNSQFSPYLSNQPSPDKLIPYKTSGATSYYSGYLYRCSSRDSNSNCLDYEMRFFLEGSNGLSCGPGTILTFNTHPDSTYCSGKSPN